MKKVFTLALIFFLFGCDAQKPELDGTYASSWNGHNITFSPNGMAVVSRQDGGPITMGGGPMPYTIEGDLIKMGALQFKRLPDGTLNGGPAFGKMTKK